MMTTKVRIFFSFLFFGYRGAIRTAQSLESLSGMTTDCRRGEWIVKYGYKFLPLLISTPPSPPTRNIQELKTTKLLSFRLVTFCGYWHRHGDGRRETEYIFLPLRNVRLYLSLSWFIFCYSSLQARVSCSVTVVCGHNASQSLYWPNMLLSAGYYKTLQIERPVHKNKKGNARKT